MFCKYFLHCNVVFINFCPFKLAVYLCVCRSVSGEPVRSSFEQSHLSFYVSVFFVGQNDDPFT